MLLMPCTPPQTWTLSETLFCCACWSHWASSVPAFPSCLSSDPQPCRMADNLLIAEAQRLRHDKAFAPAWGCQRSLNVPLTRVCQLAVAQLLCFLTRHAMCVTLWGRLHIYVFVEMLRRILKKCCCVCFFLHSNILLSFNICMTYDLCGFCFLL